MNVRYYHGERVYFRPLEPDDVPVLVEWVNDPDNWRTLGRSGPINQLREREFIAELYKSNTQVVFGVALAKDDTLIGCCGLSEMSLPSRLGVFGILIGNKTYQGQGFGTEVTRLMLRYGFEELNLNRIELDVFAGNDRGIRAYRRAGFVLEGRRRQACYRHGRFHDLLHFAMLREDWEDAASEAARDARLSSMTT